MHQFGSTLADYEVVTPIGRGAHSQVYEVRCRNTRQIYALKVIDKDRVKDENLTNKLLKEIEVHYQLKHSSVIELLHFFEDEQNVYMVLELCKRGELYTFIKENGKLSEKDAACLFLQLAEGLNYLHGNGVLHRDLKLANILLMDELKIVEFEFNKKIGDFGLAVKLKDFNEERETLCGTPNYISPEVISKQPYGLKTDIWSLGCILYALLIGNPPFECPTVQDTLIKVKDAQFLLPVFLSYEAQDLIKKLLSYNPEQRISIAEILSHPFFTKLPEKDEKIAPFPTLLPKSQGQPHQNKENKLSNNHSKPTLYKRVKILEQLDTSKLPPIKHEMERGYIKIDERGWVRLEISKRRKVMCISPNGSDILIKDREKGKLTMKYKLEGLPEKLVPIYEYARQFVNVYKKYNKDVK